MSLPPVEGVTQSDTSTTYTTAAAQAGKPSGNSPAGNDPFPYPDFEYYLRTEFGAGDASPPEPTLPPLSATTFAKPSPASPGNTFDLAGVSFVDGGSVQLLPGNVLQVTENGKNHYIQLPPGQDYQHVSFKLTSDGHGGTDITDRTGLSINLTFDPSVTSSSPPFDEPEGDGTVSGSSVAAPLKAALAQVTAAYEHEFTSTATLNIDVGWGEVAGQPMNGDLAASAMEFAPGGPGGTYTAAQVISALKSHSQSTLQLEANSNLPGVDPTGGGKFNIGLAEAKALGLVAPNSEPRGLLTSANRPSDEHNMPSVPDGNFDGWIGFDNSLDTEWSFSQKAVGPGQTDFIGLAEHEISEVMGRAAGLNQPTTTSATSATEVGYSPMDLFRYASIGRLDLPDTAKTAPTGQAFFSVDGGATAVGYWNNASNGADLGDWQTNQTTGKGSGPAPYDSFNAMTGPGYVTQWSSGDTELMNVLGWNVVGQDDYGPAQPAGNPTPLTQPVVYNSGVLFRLDPVKSGYYPTIIQAPNDG